MKEIEIMKRTEEEQLKRIVKMNKNRKKYKFSKNSLLITYVFCHCSEEGPY